MEKKKFAAAITDLLLALIGCLFILSASVVLVLNIRVIYYHDIDTLHLTEEVDLTKEQIRENYDALIDYNLFWKGEDTLQFPDFPMSEHGRIHFAEGRQAMHPLASSHRSPGISAENAENPRSPAKLPSPHPRPLHR